jgi:signal transduction histidine kinase
MVAELISAVLTGDLVGDDLRRRYADFVCARTGADAVALLAVRGGRLTVLAGTGLHHRHDLKATPIDLSLITAEDPTAIDLGDGREQGAVAALLRSEGQRTAVAVGLGRHGLPQLFLASRAQGVMSASTPSLLRAAGVAIGSLEDRRRQTEQVERRLRQQAAVAELGRRALSGEDLDTLRQAVCDVAAANLDADIAGLLERRGDRLVFTGGVGLPPAMAGRELAPSEVNSSALLRGTQHLLIPDVSVDEQFATTAIAEYVRAGSLLAVPIRGTSQTVGTLTVISRRVASYSENDVAFLSGLATILAMAMERSRVQAQLQLSIEELRKSATDRSSLLAHIVEAQEEERQRIATDIHDDSVQVMTAVALRLATIRRRAGADHDDPVFRALEHDVRQSIARLRHLMFVLSPPALEAHGIAAALHAFLAQVSEEAGLDYSLDDTLRTEPDAQVRTIVYRIAQEAVTNICNHAHASRIDIALREGDAGVVVEITDDGLGFDAERVEPSPLGHLGLLAMRERAEQSGGWWTVESQPGSGTTVRYCVGSRAGRRREPAVEARSVEGAPAVSVS